MEGNDAKEAAVKLQDRGIENDDGAVTARIRTKSSASSQNNKRWSLVVVDGKSSMRSKDKGKTTHHHNHHHHLHQHQHQHQHHPHQQRGNNKRDDNFANNTSTHVEEDDRCPTPEKIPGYNNIFASLLRTTTL